VRRFIRALSFNHFPEGLWRHPAVATEVALVMTKGQCAPLK